MSSLNISWIKEEHFPFSFHFHPESKWATPEMQEIVISDVLNSFRIIQGKLEVIRLNDTIDIYILNDSIYLQDKEAVALPDQNKLYITGPSGTLSLSKIILHKAFGDSKKWIETGLSLSINGSWKGIPLHPLACHIKYQGEFKQLKVLIKRFSSLDPRISFPLAGSFVQYLVEEYGIETVLRLYQNPGTPIPVLVGRPLDILEQEWIVALEKAGPEGVTYPIDRDH